MSETAGEDKRTRRAQLMNKFKLDTKELVGAAAAHDDETRSPGFDNETASKVFLEKRGYEIVEVLGSGAYASVFMCVDGEGEDWVIKVTRGEERQETALNEKTILETLKGGPHIPQIVGYEFDDALQMSLIKLVDSGLRMNGYTAIEETTFTETQVKSVIQKLSKGVQFIHSKGVAHRDIKPDNVVMKVDEDSVEVLMVDFNIAKIAKFSVGAGAEESKEESKFKCKYLSHIATPGSQAPEILRGGFYTESIDLWGIGLVMYALLSGHKLNRDSALIEEQVDEIEATEEAKILLKKLLSQEPEDRPTVDELVADSWLA